jgi:hypothetical protein
MLSLLIWKYFFPHLRFCDCHACWMVGCYVASFCKTFSNMFDCLLLTFVFEWFVSASEVSSGVKNVAHLGESWIYRLLWQENLFPCDFHCWTVRTYCLGLKFYWQWGTSELSVFCRHRKSGQRGILDVLKRFSFIASFFIKRLVSTFDIIIILIPQIW